MLRHGKIKAPNIVRAIGVKIYEAQALMYTVSVMNNIQRPEYIEQLPYWIFLYQSGLSCGAIAKRCGQPDSAVYSYLRRYGFIDSSNVSKLKKGSKNPMWRGSEVGYNSLHNWVAGRKPKPESCEECKIKPPLDLANISPQYNEDTYNRSLKNWRWLCRRCHMLLDGRLKKFVRYASA